MVIDELPDGLTVVSYPDECVLDGTTLTCDLGDLAAGDSVSLEIEVTIDDSRTCRRPSAIVPETATTGE